MAYNDEKNICLILEELLRQAKNTKLSFNIIVIASGCTDRTEDIVKSYKNIDSRVKLLVEKQRKGKASAINCFLNQAVGDFLIISSADVIPADGALEEFLNVFLDPSVCMVGGRPIPKSSAGITGILNWLLWELHHEVALNRPKLGEFIAIRNIVNKIPEKTAVDEAALEALITQNGLKIKYLPEVIIYNYSPKNLISFIKKRIRIFVGHLYVKEKMFYRVSTYNVIPLISMVIKRIKKEKGKAFYILMLVCLEASARVIAFFEYYLRKKTYHIWDRN